MSPARKVDAFLGGQHVVTSSTAVSGSGKSVTPGATDLPPDLPPAAKPKPARVTLNLPPDLYRQLARWADTSAEALDVPRVGVQEALRGMITVITSGEAPGASERVQAAIWEELRG